VFAGAVELEAGAVAVLVAALVAVEDAEVLELAEGTSARSLSEPSLAELAVDGPEFAACDCGGAVCAPGEDAVADDAEGRTDAGCAGAGALVGADDV